MGDERPDPFGQWWDRLSPTERKEISCQIAWFKRLNEYVLDDLITRLDWDTLPPEIRELIAK